MKAEAAEVLAKLHALEAKQVALLHELERSLLLIDLWPEVFACGPVKSTVEGTPRRWRYVVTRPDGERREWPFDDVPEKLRGPGHVA